MGAFSLGGSFGYAASGTPQVNPLASNVKTMTVTNNGPVWDSSTNVKGGAMASPGDEYHTRLVGWFWPFGSLADHCTIYDKRRQSLKEGASHDVPI